MPKQKRVLITGITGFVGSHLADYLLANTKYKLFGLKRVNSAQRNIAHLQEKVTLLNGDLIDQTSLIKVLRIAKPDYLYHLGALSWVTPSWDMPAAYMQVNAIGTINLFEALRVVGIKPRIFVSCTPEEFGDVPPEQIPITEETRIAPINPYAASKVAQDVICQTYQASYGLEIIRTRAFNHEGPRRDILGALASFAYQIAKIERKLQSPVIKVGNLEAKRNFTDVRDMVEAYVLAMEKGKPGELYLIGSNQIFTMKECLEMLISLSTIKNKISWEVDPERVRPTELRIFIGKFDKFYQLTKWQPKIPLRDTMQAILNYWREFIDKERY
ncbi:GDP-mannose 4,6-dehydratase [Candidatus Roizmanbacteria bacterium]|nr:GDP-mannose 4,6-dehydratase [Candidatus Roizmanbacteria bacterium]